MDNFFYRKLLLILPEELVRQEEAMNRHTSLRIGGKADYYVIPSDIGEVKAVLSLCRQEKIPFYIMGNGSNLLVSDNGFRGLIIRLGDRFSKVSVTEEGTITAQAGVLLSRLAAFAAEHSLTGLEFASGIPGTLGGAVTMNAGAYDGEMKRCLAGARVVDEEGNLVSLTVEELQLGYRSSILQKKDYVLLEADIRLKKGNQQQIYRKMNELNMQRKQKQPLEQCSAGSTFKRPEGYYAGKLIADAGLKGYRVGGAAVSEKHCGFLINKDHATAQEFYTLIKEIIRIVEEKSGVRLEPEVKLLGTFDA